MTRREERENIYRILFRDAFHKSAEMGEQLDLAIEGIAASPISDEEQAYIHGDGNLTEEDEQRIRTRIGEILDHKEELDSAIASVTVTALPPARTPANITPTAIPTGKL